MNDDISTVGKNTRTARTARTKRLKVRKMQTCDLLQSVRVLDLTEVQTLAAEQRLQLRRNQVADWVALLDEWLSEPRDRSTWILPRPRELLRYELLDACQLRHQPWLDYLDFAELIAAAQVAETAWRQAPHDLILLKQYHTLSEMVLDCLSPTCAEIGALHCSALPVRLNSHSYDPMSGGGSDGHNT